MKPTSRGVWLTGERFDVAYFLDLDSGQIQRFVTKGSRIGETAGICGRVSGGFVAAYVTPTDGTLVLQIDNVAYPLDGSVRAVHQNGWGGLSSRLVIEPPDGPAVRVEQRTPARAILRKVDPGYDSLDESMDDFLADIADLASSPERRAWIVRTKNPQAGPWHLLEQTS
jgi:hypothetical protein